MRVRLTNRMVAGALESAVAIATTMLFTVFLWIMVIDPNEGLTHTAGNAVGVAQCTECTA